MAFGVTRAELERSPAGVVAEEAARGIVHDLLGFEGLPARCGSSDEQRLQVGTRTAPSGRPRAGPRDESGGHSGSPSSTSSLVP